MAGNWWVAAGEWQLVAFKTWWLAASGQDVVSDTILVKRIIYVTLLIGLLLCEIDNT